MGMSGVQAKNFPRGADDPCTHLLENDPVRRTSGPKNERRGMLIHP